MASSEIRFNFENVIKRKPKKSMDDYDTINRMNWLPFFQNSLIVFYMTRVNRLSKHAQLTLKHGKSVAKNEDDYVNTFSQLAAIFFILTYS